ncbi:MAG: hypothetical protein ACI97A_004461, partial [Planctomycetota bacterium]
RCASILRNKSRSKSRIRDQALLVHKKRLFVRERVSETSSGS